MHETRSILRERAFPIIYILAKSITYLLMLIAAYGVAYGVFGLFKMFTMTG